MRSLLVKMNIQEVDELGDVFDLLDANNDGAIDPAELAQSYLELATLLEEPSRMALFRTSLTPDERYLHCKWVLNSIQAGQDR